MMLILFLVSLNICLKLLGMSFLIGAIITVVLTLYRKHAKVSREGVSQPSNISNDEIEVAKREWADLVLSDDE